MERNFSRYMTNSQLSIKIMAHFYASLQIRKHGSSKHIRPWDYPEHFEIYSQLGRKSKTWFFTFLRVYVSWIERNKILISQLFFPKFRYFANQNGPKVGPHENEFWQFSNAKNEFTKQLLNANENGGIFLFFMSPSWVMVLKLSKIVFFLQFFADVSKKCKPAIAIYVYVTGSSCFAFIKWYWLLFYHLEFKEFIVWSWWISLNFLLSRHFFDILFLNISGTVAETSVRQTLF